MDKKLNFYVVNEKYIEYLSQFDKHIAYNKNQKRPYIGIILNVNEILYFAPIFSPKLQHLKYKENLTFFKMYGNKEKTDYLGLIRFADMIPVPQNEVSIIDANKADEQYSMLLHKQYKYINKIENKKIIKQKAKEIRKIVINNNRNRMSIFYKKLCCNFKVLEKVYLLY